MMRLDLIKKYFIEGNSVIERAYNKIKDSFAFVGDFLPVKGRKISTVIKEDCVVAITRDGYAKRTNMKSYNSSQSKLPGCKEQDALVSIIKATTLDTLLVFTSGGNYLYVPVFELTENKWKDEGTHLNNISSYDGSDKIVSVICVNKFRDDLYVALASSQGSIKRVNLNDFVVSRYTRALSCMKLHDKESLVSAFITNGKTDIAVLYASGQIVRYDENQVPVVGLKAGGVRSGSRSIESSLVGAVALYEDNKRNIMIATDKGGVKPIYPRYVNSSSRNTVGTLAFKSFKSDHHDAVGLITYAENDVIQVISNFKSFELEANKVPYQPIDKIINKFVNLAKMEKLTGIVNSYTVYVDEKMVAHKVSKTETSIASFDENKVEDKKEQEKKEKYKNLSIDDLFKL